MLSSFAKRDVPSYLATSRRLRFLASTLLMPGNASVLHLKSRATYRVWALWYLLQGLYLWRFRRCQQSDGIEVSPTLPIFRFLETLRKNICGLHACLACATSMLSEQLIGSIRTFADDCIFVAFDGAFKALLPGADLNGLRAILAIPLLHGDRKLCCQLYRRASPDCG